MGKSPSISLFFPAWNEEDYVERSVARAMDVLPRLTDDFEIIIVNDASTDRTQELCEQLAAHIPQVRVITHPVNLKLGGAMRTGLSASTKDVVVYSDIDLPFDLKELERALHLMEYLEADMICAFRFDRTSEGPKRIVYSFAYNLLIRTLFGVHVKDINFSFKVMHRRVLEAVELNSQGSFIDAELVVKAIHQGFRVFQMGVDYFPRTRGVSTLSSPTVIVKMVRELAKLYPQTRWPRATKRPVRLPPSVAPLHGTARKRERSWWRAPGPAVKTSLLTLGRGTPTRAGGSGLDLRLAVRAGRAHQPPGACVHRTARGGADHLRRAGREVVR